MALVGTNSMSIRAAGADAGTDLPTAPPLAILVLTTAMAPLTMNIFLPSMPAMADIMATDKATVQLTLTLYLIGMAVGQVIYGPLSDRFGRRPLILSGLGLFVLASAACVFATTIEQLIVARVAQALGGCSGMVISRAIVRDVHDRDGAAKALGFIGMAMVMAPMMAPLIGGQLDIRYGWQASFMFAGSVGACVWVAALLTLGETNREKVPMPGLIGLARAYAALLGKLRFLGYALQTAFSMAVFFAFISGVPFLMVEVLGRPREEYGFYFPILSFGFLLGNLVTTQLTRRIGGDAMILLGSLLILAGVGTTTALAHAGIVTPLAIFAPMFLFSLGNGFAMPNALAGAVSVDPRLAGTGAGLAGFIQMGLGAAVSVMIGNLPATSPLPMLHLMLAFALLGLAAHRLGRLAAHAP